MLQVQVSVINNVQIHPVHPSFLRRWLQHREFNLASYMTRTFNHRRVGASIMRMRIRVPSVSTYRAHLPSMASLLP